MCLYMCIGMLSKAKGQILRVAACLNLLFCDYEENESIKVAEFIPLVITEEAILAAQNFVTVACQHGIFLAGRGKIEAELQRYSETLGMQQYCYYYTVNYTLMHHWLIHQQGCGLV